MALPVNGRTHLIPAYYSFYRPRKDERLSWPSWLTYSGWLTHISGHPSAAGQAQDRESSPARDRRSTTVPRHHTIRDAILVCARKPTWVSLIYRTEPTTKKCKTKKLKSKKRICSEVAVKVWGIHVVSPEEEKEKLRWDEKLTKTCGQLVSEHGRRHLPQNSGCSTHA